MRAKAIIKWILRIIVFIIIAFLLILGIFTYQTEYRIADIADSVSYDGRHELLFQSVGEPDWPFGDSHARLVLKCHGKTVTKFDFDVANDGGILYPDNWSVSWEEKCVKVIIIGEEQPDILYTLSFDGLVHSDSPKYFS